MTKIKWITTTLALVFLTIGLITSKNSPNNKIISPKLPILSTSPSENSTNIVKVTRVIDGDTIEIEGGQKVRYIGIDTPELSSNDNCFALEAAKKNKELVEGKEVRLEKDVSEVDKYDRLLRYVSVDNIFVNDYLVQQGYAYSSTFPPDVKYQDQFSKSQKEAVSEKKGLWGQVCTPSLKQTTPTGNNINQRENLNNEECIIKGNINSSGEKIYHLPGQRYYDQTKIEESKGERWFCSEQEAQEAGWRKSKV